MATEPRGRERVVAGMLASMVLAAFAVYSAGSVTHGFVSYYTASRLLVDRQLGPDAYDDRWFGEVVQRLTHTNIREIFIPNPPPMSLMALPIVALDPQPARAVWLIASLAAFLAGIGALCLAITPFIEVRMWAVYPSQVQAYVARPASSVTAYQTTLSLVRHLCVADAEWNPSPAASCAPVAFVIPWLIIAAATAITLWVSRHCDDTRWLAAAAVLSVLS